MSTLRLEYFSSWLSRHVAPYWCPLGGFTAKIVLCWTMSDMGWAYVDLGLPYHIHVYVICTSPGTWSAHLISLIAPRSVATGQCDVSIKQYVVQTTESPQITKSYRNVSVVVCCPDPCTDNAHPLTKSHPKHPAPFDQTRSILFSKWSDSISCTITGLLSRITSHQTRTDGENCAFWRLRNLTC